MQRYWQRHARHDYATDPIFDLIADERGRQDAKFGGRENPTSILPRENTQTQLYRKLGVLMEEVGEVANGILEAEFAAAITTGELTSSAIQHIKEELVQVAAVAVAWLESFDLDLELP